MKFHIYIDEKLLHKSNGSAEMDQDDIYYGIPMTKGERMTIWDDMAMLERSNMKASIHLAVDRSPYNDLSNRNIRVEKVEEEAE